MTKKTTQDGFSALLLILMVASLIGVANLPVKSASPNNQSVQGVLLAKGGDDSSGEDSQRSGDSGSSSSSGSSGASGSSGSSTSNSQPTSKPASSDEIKKESDKKAQEVQLEAQKKKVEVEKKRLEAEKKVKEVKLEIKKKEKEATHEAENEVEDEQENEIENELEEAKAQKIEFKLNNGEIESEIEDASGEGKQRKNRGKNLSFNLNRGKKEIKLKIEDNKFKFESKGTEAQTNFPLTFNKETGTLSVTTPNGVRIIRVLPDQASEIAKSAGVQNKIEDIELTEDSNKVVFKIKGTKSGAVFGLFPISSDVETEVSADSGELLSTREPLWLKLLKPLIK